MKIRVQNLLPLLALLAAATGARADTVYVSNISSNNVTQFTLGGAGSVFANTGPQPLGLAFDSAGNLYVGKPAVNTIEKFSSTGTDLGVFVDSGVTTPYAMVFDHANNLYVANAGANTVVKITPGGVSSVFASNSLFYPSGLAIDSTDNLYVSSGNTSSIYKISSNGTDLGFFASSSGSNPVGLAFDSAGYLYVANQSGQIVKIATNGVGTLFANIGPNAFGLAFDGAGNLYVSYNTPYNFIEKFSPTGTVLGAFATGLSNPGFIAIKIDVPPTLHIAPVGNQSILFWPASGTNYVLQSSTNLNSTNWVTATDAVPVIAFTVSNSSPATFYRLQKQ